MPNPFDDPDGSFLVVVNEEEQHSLWPVCLAVPDGWTVRKGECSRQECLDFINENWTDMRPLSLRRAMDAGAQ